MFRFKGSKAFSVGKVCGALAGGSSKSKAFVGVETEFLNERPPLPGCDDKPESEVPWRQGSNPRLVAE